MLTAAEARAFANEYKSMSLASTISQDRAFILKYIARSFVGLASQLDILEAKIRDEKR